MLYSREYSTFLVTTIRGFHVLFQSLFMQIKYLRVPDNLLDIVKDEQNRARDANRNSRGGHNGGECRNIYIYRKSDSTDLAVPMQVGPPEASLGVVPH